MNISVPIRPFKVSDILAFIKYYIKDESMQLWFFNCLLSGDFLEEKNTLTCFTRCSIEFIIAIANICAISRF